MSISTRYLPVAIALSYLGATTRSEKHREIISVYNSVKPHGYTMRLSDPWCAAFWSACQIMAGNTQKDVPMSASCSQIIADAKALGIWQENEAVKPQVGWAVLYDWQDSGYGDNQGSPDHIGMVYDVDDKYIYVIEGNKGAGVVGKRAVAINGRYLRGFVKPKYDSMHKVQYRPTTAYKGQLPTDDVMYGKVGTDAKDVQRFLNWLDDAKLAVDGSCGKLTTQAILDYQYTYGLELDGCFGPKCRAKARALIKKYTPQSWQDKANEWARESAKTRLHYVKWGKNPKTHTCPICTGRIYDDDYGYNCIGYSFAVLHHGGGLKNKCNCGVIANEQWEKLLKLPQAEADALATKLVGIPCEVIRNGGKAIPLSRLRKGDIVSLFNDSTYIHTAYYMGDGKYADCTSTRKPNIKADIPVGEAMRKRLLVAVRVR